MLQDINRMGPNQIAADTASGFMIGLLEIHNYDNLTACFHEPEAFSQQIQDALDLLVSKKNESIAEAIHKIAQVTNLMPNTLFDCSEKTFNDAAELQSWSDNLP